MTMAGALAGAASARPQAAPAPAPAQAGPVQAQAQAGQEPTDSAAPTLAARAADRARLDALFAELRQPGDEGDWRRAEAGIQRIWSRSGSAAMDLLLARAEAALDAGDTDAAIGHLTALTDRAPDFAAGWYLRAVALHAAGETGPALADLAQALRLEPRHYPALTQLGAILEELGQDRAALAACRASLAINPHQQDAADACARLERIARGQDA